MPPADEDPLVEVAIDEGTPAPVAAVEAVAAVSGTTVADLPPLAR